MKTVFVTILLLAAFQQQQGCSSSSGPLPMRILQLPDATCDVPYTGQFITGGVTPYTITVGQITDPSGTPIAGVAGLAIAQQGGASSPLQSNTTVNNATGFIVGTFPCSSLASSSQQVLLAGSKFTIRKPLQ